MTWFEVAAALRPRGPRLHERAAEPAVHRRRHARRRRHRRELAAPRLRRGSGGGARGRHADRRDRAREGRRRLPGARAPRLRAVRRHHEGADQGAPVPPDDRAPLPVHGRRRRARRHDAPRRAGRRGGLRHPDLARRCRGADPGLRGGAGRLPAAAQLRAADHGDGRLPLRRASLALARCRLPETASGGPPAGAAQPALRPGRARARSRGRLQPPDLAPVGRTARGHPGSRDHDGELRGRRPARHRRVQAVLPVLHAVCRDDPQVRESSALRDERHSRDRRRARVRHRVLAAARGRGLLARSLSAIQERDLRRGARAGRQLLPLRRRHEAVHPAHVRRRRWWIAIAR